MLNSQGSGTNGLTTDYGTGSQAASTQKQPDSVDNFDELVKDYNEIHIRGHNGDDSLATIDQVQPTVIKSGSRKHIAAVADYSDVVDL